VSDRSKRRKAKKRKHVAYEDIELNIMPFIDVFSLLNTFLLMSAVFLSIAVIEVQIPFLSSAPPDKKDTERTLDVKVDMEKDKLTVTTSFTKAPVNEQTQVFEVNTTGFAAMHKHLVTVRQSNPETDKVSFFTDDDVIGRDMAAALDAIKQRKAGDPIFALKPGATDVQKAEAATYLFPKVVLASVILK
jgi:biopolymer transport protein ExbD